MLAKKRMQFSDARYLLSKRSVDDRALNQNVVATVRRRLAAGPKRPRVLELGAGLGTMVCRALEWNLIAAADYTLLDIDGPSLDEAMQVLERWGTQRGLQARALPGRTLELEGDGISLRVTGVVADLEHWLEAASSERYDLLVANAFLDLVELQTAIPRLWSRLNPAGTFWLTINFDGETIWLPEDPRDEQVMRLYHRSMDERVREGKRAGDSKTGRRLYHHLVAARAAVEAVGSSDWAVHPVAGAYPADEHYFLHHMVETVWRELRNHPELDRADFEAWVDLRRAQIDQAELVLVVHQLDYAGGVG